VLEAAMSDEQLIQAFYKCCDVDAVKTLADRYHGLLARVVYLALLARTGSPLQARHEWLIDDLVQDVWALVYVSYAQNAPFRWHAGVGSVLAWLVSLAVRVVDRHLGYPKKWPKLPYY
jgi:DNA-directed RNA polymerase specialized sigma24 family protein